MKINPAVPVFCAGVGLFAGAFGGVNSGLAMAGASLVASVFPGWWANLLFWTLGAVAAYMVRV